MKRSRFVPYAVKVGFILSLVAGCSVADAPTIDEIASTHTAVISVEPWNLAAPLLNPNFQITGDSARPMVLPNTANVSGAIVNAIAAQLQVSAVGGSDKHGTINDASTSGAMSTQQPPSAQTIAGLLPAGLPLVQDPVLTYNSAANLVEEVTMLNNKVQNAARRYGYRPYLVRLSVDVLPYKHHATYDTYADMSFFTLSQNDVSKKEFSDPDHYFSRWRNSDLLSLLQKDTTPSDDASKPDFTIPPKMPVVVPLLVTENLAGANTSTASDNIRQLSAAITALTNNVKADAGLQSLADALKTITGTSLNSVENIGLHTDNTIRLRMGGLRDPSSTEEKYIIVPRTHYVTLLLLAPLDWDNGPEPRSIHVVTQISFRNSGDSYSWFIAKLKQMSDNIYRNSGTAYSADAVKTDWDKIDGMLEKVFTDDSIKPFYKKSDDGSINNTLDLRHNKKEETIAKLNERLGTCPKIQDKEEAFNDAYNPNVTADAYKHYNDGGLLLAYYLFDRASYNDRDCFLLAMNAFNMPLDFHEYIWNSLTRIASSMGESEATIDLTPRIGPRFPPDQTIILVDDKKSGAVGHLIGGLNIAADRIMAELDMPSDNAAKPDAKVMAKSVTFSNNNDLQLTFPSLFALCPKDRHGVKNCEYKQPSLVIWQRVDPWLSGDIKSGCNYELQRDECQKFISNNDGFARTKPYPVSLQAADGTTAFTLDTNVTALVPNLDHTGKVVVFLKNVPSPNGYSQIKIEAAGGEITGYGVGDITTPTAPQNGVILLSGLSGNGVVPPNAPPIAVYISLRNLTPGTVLQLTATPTTAPSAGSPPLPASTPVQPLNPVSAKPIVLLDMPSTRVIGVGH